MMAVVIMIMIMIMIDDVDGFSWPMFFASKGLVIHRQVIKR